MDASLTSLGVMSFDAVVHLLRYLWSPWRFWSSKTI